MRPPVGGANVQGMAGGRQRRLTLALLVVAVSALIARLVANVSGSLFGGLAVVGELLGLALVAAIFLWHGDFL